MKRAHCCFVSAMHTAAVRLCRTIRVHPPAAPPHRSRCSSRRLTLALHATRFAHPASEVHHGSGATALAALHSHTPQALFSSHRYQPDRPKLHELTLTASSIRLSVRRSHACALPPPPPRITVVPRESGGCIHDQCDSPADSHLLAERVRSNHGGHRRHVLEQHGQRTGGMRARRNDDKRAMR